MNFWSAVVVFTTILCVLIGVSSCQKPLYDTNRILRAASGSDWLDNSAEVTAVLTELYKTDWGKRRTQDGLQQLVMTSAKDAADGVSEGCISAVEATMVGLANGENWALRMIDAAGKPPSSLIRDRRLYWMGSYSECVEVSATTPKPLGNSTNVTINGQYCRAFIPLGSYGSGFQASTVNFAEALCMPDACNQSESEAIVRAGLLTVEALFPNLTYNASQLSVECQPRERTMDTKGIVATAIVGLFLLAMIAGTTYDVWDQFFRDGPVEVDELGLVVNFSKKDRPKGLLTQLLLAFSVYTNGRKILSANQNAGALECVNGIRFISMTWVILGHTLAIAGGVKAINVGDYLGDLPQYLKRWTFLAIMNATVSVDTFFVLSGLLVTYLSMKEMERRKGNLNWAMFYIHRYIRLTPPYMLVMMVYVCLLTYMGSGPGWQTDVDPFCEKNWWTNLLYINNIVNDKQMCMGWSWYLANDMQFFIISPIILIPLFKSAIIGLVVWFAFLLGTVITPGVISSINYYGPALFGTVSDKPPDVHLTGNSFEDLYIRPYTRMSSYLAGVLVGYILYKTKCKAKIPLPLVFLGWLAAAFLCIATLYGVYDPLNGKPWTDNVSAFYNATSRFAWSLGVGWVIFACCSGYGGFVNMLLSWKGIIPLSRLTYCAYLVHPAVMMWFRYQQETLVLFTIPNLIYLFFGNLFAAYLVAFVASLMFESTTMGVEKALLGRFK